MLFDVNALTVLRSSPLDGVALKAASGGGASVHELVDRLVAGGADRSEAQARIEVLCEHRFLLPEGEEPELPPVGRPSAHATFMVNVAQRCNLTCPYCYVNKGLFDYEEKPIARMQAPTADGIVDQIHTAFPGFETYGYHFYGGEPLMNFDAIERVVAAAVTKAEATNTKAEYFITTNGTLLTKSVADFMDAHRFTVYFSIDGDQETHDELRKFVNGRGSFKVVEKNLAYLRTKPGVHLIGSSVIRKGFPLEKAIDLLESHGARQCKAERVRLFDDDELALRGSEHAAYLSDIEALFDEYVDALDAGRKPMDYRLTSKVLQLLTKTRRDFFCPAGERMYGVSADGEVYPCALHVGRPQSKLGDLATGVDPERRKAFRSKFSWQSQPDCQGCWTRHLCGGGCSAMVDRFGHENCASLRAESEAAIAIYQHFADEDVVRLYGLVSPKIAKWVSGEIDDADELAPTEAAAQKVGHWDVPSQ